jgi:hypothetical protein
MRLGGAGRFCIVLSRDSVILNGIVLDWLGNPPVFKRRSTMHSVVSVYNPTFIRPVITSVLAVLSFSHVRSQCCIACMSRTRGRNPDA